MIKIRGRSVEFVVETFLAYDRATQTVSPEWVDFRLRFFHLYTLKSLLGQTFQDFRIFIQCGERHREKLESYAWHPRAEPCFLQGRGHYSDFVADYLVIIRIDSDDLFHRENLDEVRKELVFSDRRSVLCWKERCVWDWVNGYFLSSHQRPSSPFFVHIFPRKVYENWPKFKDQHFRAHGSGGAGDSTAKPLKPGRVVVVKHGWNHSKLKRGQVWPTFGSDADRRAVYARIRRQYPRIRIVDDRADVIKLLEPFGVTEELVP